VVILGCLVLSALALGLAPLLMPESYSWLSHTTSESAAQGVEGAWLARLGFLSFGLGVIWLASPVRGHWDRLGSAFHRSFGLLMVATAVFSHRPFEAGSTFDRTEDLLHSVAATAMGFAFAFGVAVVLFKRREWTTSGWFLDAVAVAASVLIPLSMFAWGESAGLLQRVMFAVAYIWYGRETLKSLRAPAEAPYR
jgi:hypothetical protein